MSRRWRTVAIVLVFLATRRNLNEGAVDHCGRIPPAVPRVQHYQGYALAIAIGHRNQTGARAVGKAGFYALDTIECADQVIGGFDAKVRRPS